MRKLHTGCRCWPRLLPVLLAAYAVGCLPDNAFRQVLGENVLLTAAYAIQTSTWLFFNRLFGYI